MTLFLNIILPLILTLVLVGVVAFFAASESAYLSITKVTLRQLIKECRENKKNAAARRVVGLKKDNDFLLSLILIGINFVTSLASGLAATVAINIFGQVGSTYATIVMSIVLIIFGEITPKTVATVYPVKCAKAFSGPLALLKRIFFPIVWIFARISGLITSFLQLFLKEKKDTITEEELRSLISAGEHEGTLEHSEKRMLDNIFEFTDLKIHDIMKHRSLVKFVPIDADYEEVVKIFTETGFARLPVCDSSFEKVCGMIHYRNVLLMKAKSSKSGRKFVKSCMRKALFVPETLSASELLQKFRQEKKKFAVAVDENGSNSGIVTMDDLLRAVFGRSVPDDTAEIPPEKRIKPLSATEYLVPGDMRLDDVNDLLRLGLDSENYETLAGWILEQFDALPEAGEVIRRGEIVYKVEEQTRRRVQSVRIIFPAVPVSKVKGISN